jgi:putative transposase
MPRTTREIESGLIYHVLNRGNGRRPLFRKDPDFAAFVKLLAEALKRFEVDLLAFCLMGNHWHLLLRPRKARSLSQMMAWLTVTHARRHHMHYPDPGSGHVYQGRFKSFPVESDEHFLIVARYIHANPLRARLVKRAQDWRWSDLTPRSEIQLPRCDWPMPRPRNWVRLVNEVLPETDASAIRTSIQRGSPFGSPQWTRAIAAKLKLHSTLRPRGRPRQPIEWLSPRYRRQRERREAEKSG